MIELNEERGDEMSEWGCMWGTGGKVVIIVEIKPHTHTCMHILVTGGPCSAEVS